MTDIATRGYRKQVEMMGEFARKVGEFLSERYGESDEGHDPQLDDLFTRLEEIDAKCYTQPNLPKRRTSSK